MLVCGLRNRFTRSGCICTSFSLGSSVSFPCDFALFFVSLLALSVDFGKPCDLYFACLQISIQKIQNQNYFRLWRYFILNRSCHFWIFLNIVLLIKSPKQIPAKNTITVYTIIPNKNFLLANTELFDLDVCEALLIGSSCSTIV